MQYFDLADVEEQPGDLNATLDLSDCMDCYIRLPRIEVNDDLLCSDANVETLVNHDFEQLVTGRKPSFGTEMPEELEWLIEDLRKEKEEQEEQAQTLFVDGHASFEEREEETELDDLSYTSEDFEILEMLFFSDPLPSPPAA